jgi:hypothetical protein
MRKQIRTSATAVVFLLVSAGFAGVDHGGIAPHDRLTLSGAQELAIFHSVSRQKTKKATAPSGFEPEIGQTVPEPISLHKLPSDAASTIPTVKPYDYAMLQNQLLIVNPHDRIAVDVIARDVASNQG